MLPLYLAVVFAAGALIAMQAGVNAQLSRAMGHPVLAAAVSFAVATAALLLASIGVAGSWTGVALSAQVPWWAWCGGLLGAVFVVTAAWLAPTLGASTLLSVAIAGQMTAALILDHYGLVGFPQRPLTAGRVGGVLLVVAGVVLIRRC